MPYGAWGDLLVLVLAVVVFIRPSRPYAVPLAGESPGHVISL
jgi:hypothetical protein